VKLRDEKGFTAFKVRLGVAAGHDGDAAPGRTEELIPAIRKALGGGVQLLADGNSCYTPPKAIEIGRRMEDQGYYWFEEPCPYWELEWTAEVAAALRVKIAGGEQDNDLAQWRRMIRMKAVDILQPDLCYAGGFTRSWRIARLGREAGLQVVPHSSHLAPITLFSLHLMAAIPNAGPFVEFSIEEDANAGERLYSPALKVVDGRVKIPDAPGWGIRINPAWIEKADWRASSR
jgi:L-alanine-DL-glutamate epimerase-like enolase superfamily enzyme